MNNVTKKTVYRLQSTSSSQVGFEVTVTDEGVEIDTVHGLGVEDFIKTMQELVTHLNDEYTF
jgi:hypothetical protein